MLKRSLQEGTYYIKAENYYFINYIGAHGARPVLKNLTESELSHFRKQIQIIDFLGERDLSELVRQVELLGWRVNLNKACVEDFGRLDGVGMEKAKLIIDYRVSTAIS